MSELDELLLVPDVSVLAPVAAEPVVSVAEPVALPVAEPLTLPDALDVEVSVLVLAAGVSVAGVSELMSELLRVASRLQPAKPSASAANVDTSVSFNWLFFMILASPRLVSGV